MENFVNDLVPLAFIAFLTAIFVAPSYFRHREREKMQEVLKVAYEKGHPVPPEVINAMQTSMTRVASTPESDLRRAIVLIAVGIGMVGLGYGLWYGISSVSDEGGSISGPIVAGTGAIPGMIGLAYLVLWATRRKAPKA
jgi:hypothetical protein